MSRRDLIGLKEEMLKFEALIFKFDGNCPNCEKNMTKFVSENKSVFLCEHCGCIYVPNNIRNIKINSFKYERYKGVLTPICLPPTELQINYLKFLANEIGVEIDIDSVTKEEAKVLIDMLKIEYDKKPYPKNEYNLKKPNKSNTSESIEIKNVLNKMYGK